MTIQGFNMLFYILSINCSKIMLLNISMPTALKCALAEYRRQLEYLYFQLKKFSDMTPKLKENPASHRINKRINFARKF
jgi:hypothetical protein